MKISRCWMNWMLTVMAFMLVTAFAPSAFGVTLDPAGTDQNVGYPGGVCVKPMSTVSGSTIKWTNDSKRTPHMKLSGGCVNLSRTSDLCVAEFSSGGNNAQIGDVACGHYHVETLKKVAQKTDAGTKSDPPKGAPPTQTLYQPHFAANGNQTMVEKTCTIVNGAEQCTLENRDVIADIANVEKRVDDVEGRLTFHEALPHLQFLPGAVIGEALPALPKKSCTLWATDRNTGLPSCAALKTTYEAPVFQSEVPDIEQVAVERSFCSSTACKVFFYGVLPVVAGAALVAGGVAVANGGGDYISVPVR